MRRQVRVPGRTRIRHSCSHRTITRYHREARERGDCRARAARHSLGAERNLHSCRPRNSRRRRSVAFPDSGAHMPPCPLRARIRATRRWVRSYEFVCSSRPNPTSDGNAQARCPAPQTNAQITAKQTSNLQGWSALGLHPPVSSRNFTILTRRGALGKVCGTQSHLLSRVFRPNSDLCRPS